MRIVKLEDEPRQRLKVHQLAKQVGHSSRELTELLTALGEHVNSPHEYVEVPVIRRVHEELGVTYRASARPTAAPFHPSPATSGLGPPKPRPKRENHPLMPVAERPRDRARQPVRGAPPRKGFEWRSRQDEDEFAMATRSDASPAFAFEEWKWRGFSDFERDVWMEAGLRSGQAKTAATLRDQGVLPLDLARDLSGWTLLQRLRKGEGAEAIARLFKAQEADTG